MVRPPRYKMKAGKVVRGKSKIAVKVGGKRKGSSNVV